MKFKLNSKLWRGRNGRLYRLADLIQDIAESIRYANKPHDLVYPITRLTDLTNQARQMMWDWLAEKIGFTKKNQGRWPHL